MNTFKKNDKIIVISGKDKGKISKILKVFPKSSTVLLDNCHFVTKHQKASQKSQGGIKQLAKQISWSNIMHYDEKMKKATRIRIDFTDKKKVRILQSCEKEI